MLSVVVLVLTSWTTFSEYRAMQDRGRAILTLTKLPFAVACAVWPAILGCIIAMATYNRFNRESFHVVQDVALCVIIGMGSATVILHFAKRVNIFCPHCEMFVERSKDWVCGYCKNLNEGSLLELCSTCKRTPTGYVCVECRKAVPLALKGTVDEKHLATHAHMPPAPPPVVEKKPDATLLRKEAKEEREHEILMTRLNALLKTEEANLEHVIESTKKPQKKSVEDEFTEHHENFMRVQEIAEREIVAVKRKFKDNPDLQRKFIESIEIWRNERM